MAVPDGPVLQQSIDCGNDPCEGEDEEVRDETNEFQEKDYLTDKVNATTEMKQEWLKVRGGFGSIGSRLLRVANEFSDEVHF